MNTKNWAAWIGWAIFIALVVSMLMGKYIFDPFVFGCTYFIVYVLARTKEADLKERPDIAYARLLLVGIIGLVYIWFSLTKNVSRDSFIESFEKVCWPENRLITEEHSRICEELQSNVEAYLTGPEMEEEW